mmetsp:Transcript_38654/g.111659  ORF Transcript_38654/g.111659 Transcript_38654/m.111659 type:complete len:111 (-) Transcript_38654:106-438(-)
MSINVTTTASRICGVRSLETQGIFVAAATTREVPMHVAAVMKFNLQVASSLTLVSSRELKDAMTMRDAAAQARLPRNTLRASMSECISTKWRSVSAFRNLIVKQRRGWSS